MARLLVEQGGTTRYVELGDRPLRVGAGTACELLVGPWRNVATKNLSFLIRKNFNETIFF